MALHGSISEDSFSKKVKPGINVEWCSCMRARLQMHEIKGWADAEQKCRVNHMPKRILEVISISHIANN
jgi:hypothetical protein